MASNKQTMIAEFNFEIETKGALRFTEVAPDDNPKIGTLYLKKSALAGARPQVLRVSIEVVK